MGAFTLEFEHRRLSEPGAKKDVIQKSLEPQLRSLLAERTHTVNPFELSVHDGVVGAEGFEHRGDLSESFKKSVEEAKTDIVARRYQLENDGYEEVKKGFFGLQPYSTIVLCSPTPEVHMDGYPGYNLLYLYHILPGQTPKERVIKAFSFINYFDKAEQAEILNSLSFSNSVLPTERSILLNPVGVTTVTKDVKSAHIIWRKIEEVYKRKERNFTMVPAWLMEQFLLNGQEFWNNKHQVLAVMNMQIAKEIASGATEKRLKDKWAIWLNLADRELLHQDISTQKKEQFVYQKPTDISYPHTIFDRYSHLSYDPRPTATSCGMSAGLGQRSDNPLGMLELSNPINFFNFRNALITTKTFTVESTKDDLGDKEFPCPACQHKNIRPYNETIPRCQNEKCPKPEAVAC